MFKRSVFILITITLVSIGLGCGKEESSSTDGTKTDKSPASNYKGSFGLDNKDYYCFDTYSPTANLDQIDASIMNGNYKIRQTPCPREGALGFCTWTETVRVKKGEPEQNFEKVYVFSKTGYQWSKPSAITEECDRYKGKLTATHPY